MDGPCRQEGRTFKLTHYQKFLERKVVSAQDRGMDASRLKFQMNPPYDADRLAGDLAEIFVGPCVQF